MSSCFAHVHAVRHKAVTHFSLSFTVIASSPVCFVFLIRLTGVWDVSITLRCRVGLAVVYGLETY